MAKASFNEAVDSVLGEAIAVSNQRGSTYADSWHPDNVKTTFLDAVLEVIGDDQTVKAKRLMIVAVMADVKVSRFVGQWHADNIVDLINYLAALGFWMDAYLNERIVQKG